MALKKITETEMDQQGVCAAPDILQGTPAENKALFDRMVRQLVAPAVNELVDVVETAEENQDRWSAAEQGRVVAENSRQTAESARAAAETERQSAESGRESAEQERSSAEQKRLDGEKNRVSNEAARQSAEFGRESAEDQRASAEQSRVSAEQSRIAAEQGRLSAEAQRASAETDRHSKSAAMQVWEDYDSAKSYVPLNKVTWNGSSYICVQPCTGVTPDNGDYWLMIAKRGIDGATVSASGQYGFAVEDGHLILYYTGDTPPDFSIDESGHLILNFDDTHTMDIGAVVGKVTDEQVSNAVSVYLSEHPEATTTVQDGSITQAKMAFPALEGQISQNLIDPTGLISARFTSVNGGRQAFPETSPYYNYWRMTDYIDVSSHVGEQIWVHNVQGYCFYDSNKAVIADSGFYQTSLLADTAVMGVDIPDGASYFVVAIRNADNRVFTANFGGSLAVYVPYGQIGLKEDSVTADHISGVLPISKIDTSNLILPRIGLNLIDKSRMIKDMWISTSGVPASTAESLRLWYVDGIKVKGGETYLAFCARLVFYDTYGNVCGIDTTTDDNELYRKVTTPAGAATCAVNGKGYTDCITNMVHQEFLVEGDTLPTRIVNEKYYAEDSVDSAFIYKSVLHRMADCWDYTTKTTIGLCGDSNTIGIKGSGDIAQNPNCWANLLTAEVERKLSGERYIFPFCDVGVWGCRDYGVFGQEANLLTGSVIKIPFYGTGITMSTGSVNSVPVTLSVEIDGEAQDDITLETATEYTWSGLSEGPHTIQIVMTRGNNYCVDHFTVQKTVEVINRGISGRSLSHIETDVGVSGDTIDIVCLGTNDRGSGAVLQRDGCLDRWEYTNRNTKIIYMSPIPARDDIETANEAWKTVPYIESFIAGREARKNCEYISLYHELIDYCDRTGTDIATLYVDGLHLNDAGHKVIAKILCRKLGLGDLTETTD